MWIFLNDSMLSVVKKPDDADTLTVRARIKGDIEAVFPGAPVVEGSGSDYRFRTRLPREVVAQALFDRAMDVDYENFKGSVKEKTRHDAYLGAWQSMFSFQENRKRKERVA